MKWLSGQVMKVRATNQDDTLNRQTDVQ